MKALEQQTKTVCHVGSVTTTGCSDLSIQLLMYVINNLEIESDRAYLHVM